MNMRLIFFIHFYSRCAPVLEIILRVLAAYTQACRVYMENHIQSNPVLDGNNQVEQDRQELKNCLLAAQESAMIQILLEYCQAKPDERKVSCMIIYICI